MKRAFILHRRAQDVSEIGMKVDETKVVIDGKIYPFDPGDLLEKIESGMSSLDTEQDYVVLMGSTVVNFLAGYALGLKKPRRLKLMIHDVKSGRYREVVLVPEGRHHGGKRD